MGKSWDLIGSLLSPCCLPSAPYTCADFIWSGTQCFHVGEGEEREKEQCQVKEKEQRREGNTFTWCHRITGDHPDGHWASGMDRLLLMARRPCLSLENMSL